MKWITDFSRTTSMYCTLYLYTTVLYTINDYSQACGTWLLQEHSLDSSLIPSFDFFSDSHLTMFNSIHPMQIWRTTPSSPGMSCMKARLVGPRCLFWLASSEKSCIIRDLDWFISLCVQVCHQKVVKYSTGKKVFLVSLFASEGKADEGKEFDPIHDRRVNG